MIIEAAKRCECRQHPAFYPLRSHRQRSRGLLHQRARNDNTRLSASEGEWCVVENRPCPFGAEK